MRAQQRQPGALPRARVWSVVSTIGRVVTLLAVAVAAATVLTLVWFNVRDQQVLIVTSGSMAPAFHTGDAVIVERPDPSRLRAGDVVTFRTSAGGKTTTHRIHQLKPKAEGLFLQTKGDANTAPDPNFVSASAVSGVMTGSIPHLGRWLAFFQSPRGKVLVLGTPLLLIMLAQAFSMLGDWRDTVRAGAQVGAQDAGSPPPTGQPNVRVVAVVVTLVLALSVLAGVGVGRRTSARFTDTDPLGVNLLGTRAPPALGTVSS